MAEMRYYVTADTHGYCTLLRNALEQSGYFADRGPHRLVILGDLFDRGEEAKEMQDFILREMEIGNLILVKGNHEDLFMELAKEDKGLPYSHHVSNGTYHTALQLTGFDPTMARIRNLDFADAAGQTLFATRTIPSMLDYYETERYIFVHGWIPCIADRRTGYSYFSGWRDVDPFEWKRARWYNGMDAFRTCMEEKTILCGHWHNRV